MAMKQLPEDFKDFIKFLNEHKVRYLLVGGWAVGIYDENINNLLKVLKKFGTPIVEKSVFQIKGNVFRMGRSPVQIDLINEASGIIFEDCYKRRNIIKTDEIDISVISKEDLIKNKRASGRHRDLADIESFEES